MGHERTPSLPKTQRWRQLVEEIAEAAASRLDVATVVSTTLENIRTRFDRIDSDKGVQSAFEFLVVLSVFSRSSDLHRQLLGYGIPVTGPLSPLNLAIGLGDWMESPGGSLEYRAMAQSAACDALSRWFASHADESSLLFEGDRDPTDVWRALGTGAGFCEISRLFFARFTERHLRYFIDREASSAINTLFERDLFDRALQEHVEGISKHAFETARITQSFAAGWFNRHAREGVPSDEQRTRFLRMCFGKLREELRREKGG